MPASEMLPHLQYASAITNIEKPTTFVGTRVVVTLPGNTQIFLAALADVGNNNPPDMATVEATTNFLYAAESLLTQPSEPRLPDVFAQALVQTDAAVQRIRTDKTRDISIVAVAITENGAGFIANIGNLARAHVTMTTRSGSSVTRLISPTVSKEGALQLDEAKKLTQEFTFQPGQLLMLSSSTSILNYLNWRDILGVLHHYHAKGIEDWLDKAANRFVMPRRDQRLIPNASVILVRRPSRR